MIKDSRSRSAPAEQTPGVRSGLSVILLLARMALFGAILFFVFFPTFFAPGPTLVGALSAVVPVTTAETAKRRPSENQPRGAVTAGVLGHGQGNGQGVPGPLAGRGGGGGGGLGLVDPPVLELPDQPRLGLLDLDGRFIGDQDRTHVRLAVVGVPTVAVFAVPVAILFLRRKVHVAEGPCREGVAPIRAAAVGVAHGEAGGLQRFGASAADDRASVPAQLGRGFVPRRIRHGQGP